MVKQRELTKAQATLLRMQYNGSTKQSIAKAIGVCVATVDSKIAAINKGMAKNAYLLPDDIKQLLSKQKDMFALA